ncbi:MAG TPA: amidase [Acidimicrobiales bacterium]
MTALHELGVVELLDGFRDRRFGPMDVLDACLDRIDRGADLGAVVAVDVDRARRDARVAEQRWQRGEARPLEGVPLGVKDVIATEGLRTTLGSERFAGMVPESDAASVARLRSAGAVVVAKLATPELAFGDARDGHQPRNPWSPAHWTGGSSSGSAVALAARVLPLALGTDTGGSIRVPAAYCAVTGLKPTTGRVPTQGVGTVSWTLDHVGAMARSVDDVALAYAALAGGTLPIGSDRSWRDVRIGVPRSWLVDNDLDGTVAAMDAALDVWRSLGADVVDVAVPDRELAAIAAWVITVVEFAEVHADWRAHVDAYTAAAQERLAAGSVLPAGDYVRSLRVRNEMQQAWQRVFDDVDVVVTPATPTAALRVEPTLDPAFGGGDLMWLDGVARYLIPFNLVGLPALVMPAGWTSDGRPIGVQVVGRPFDEAGVLSVARAFQSATEHHRVVPAPQTTGVGART